MKTLKTAVAVAGFLFFAFLLTNCKKEYSYEGGLTVENSGSLATYVIASGVDHCDGQIGGAFTAGTTQNASNTYTLTVYVSVVGNFTISTQTVNGITFQYTGTFTKLGTNFVTLRAYGIPLHVGSFTMTPEIAGSAPLGGSSCDFLLAVK